MHPVRTSSASFLFAQLIKGDGIIMKQVAQLPLSLETPTSEEEDSVLGDFIEDETVEGPVDAASNQLLKEQVHRIVGCAMEVLNVLGHGLREKTYENALVVEFGLQRDARLLLVEWPEKAGGYVPLPDAHLAFAHTDEPEQRIVERVK